MYSLTPLEFSQVALPVMRQIFKDDNPYGEPFASKVEERLVLHEYYYNMSSPLLEAVVQAATNLGETGFYITLIPYAVVKDFDYPCHWYLPFTEINQYPSFIGGVENIIFSPDGNWGIMSTEEDFGLLGSTTAFINEIRKRLPDINEQVQGFLKTWVYNKQHYASDTSWIFELLSNVYSKKEAENLLKMYNLL